jgi:hypothetical protein
MTANAQVFKCSYAVAASQRTETIYTDEPCTKDAKQSVTLVANKLAPQIDSLKRASVSRMDTGLQPDALTQAVLNNDFELAKTLAKTKEDWRLIALTEQVYTEKRTAQKPIAVIPPAAIKPVANAPENADQRCSRASANFDYNTRNHWRDNELVAASKASMQAACSSATAQMVPSGGYYPAVAYYPAISYYPRLQQYWRPSIYPHHHDGFNYGGHYPNVRQFDGNAQQSNWHDRRYDNDHHTSEGLSLQIQGKRFGLQLGAYTSTAVESRTVTTVSIANGDWR